MRTASAIYKMVRALDNHWYDWRVTQNETTYGMDSIRDLSVSYALTSEDGIDVGNANSAKCELTLIEESANWARMASFTVQFRIRLGSSGTISEWITLAKFYTDTRSENKFGDLTIVGYDKMLMMEQTWSDKVPESLLPASYPITARAWATMIQDAGLATFADLTQLNDTVAFVGLDTNLTIRDVLKDIAAVHAGNWKITPSTETLNLVLFENVTESDTGKFTRLGLSMQDFDDSPALPAVTGVHLETESGTVVEFGSDVGYRLKKVCAFSDTSGVAELCLSQITGFVYKPFEADTAFLDPITEIGDSVIVDDVIYQIITIDWTLDKEPSANVKAPYDQEIDHEYTMLDPDTKNYRKTLSMVNQQMDDYVQWDEVSTAITQNAESVVLAAEGSFVSQAEYDQEIAEIQSQIDGSIQTWSGNAVPTLSNEPAVNWTTASDKASHVGDTYFVNSDAGIAEAGNYYRFSFSDGTYSWQLLNDTVATEALAQAAAAQAAATAAQTTANAASTAVQEKGKIFVVQPTPPYNVGDLWFNNTDSVIKVCMTARASGDYVASDWVKRDNYADGSEFEAFLETYQETIDALRNQVDQKAETYYQSSDPSINWGIHPVGVAVAGVDVAGSPANIGETHIGDLWYNTNDNTTWYWSGTTWEQQEVPEEVFDKIDGKAQVFVVEPYAPYNVGDLWFNSNTSDIMTCINSRTESGFIESDWQKRNKYTDDTQLNVFKSEFTVQPNQIRAEVEKRVVKDQSETKNSFGWLLNDNSHVWYANNAEIMRLEQSGLTVTGEIRATSGFIGGGSATGFAISATAISNGMTSLNDTTHSGVYIGTNGIALGAGNFKVTSGGVITAKSGTIGGFTISASSLYNGMTSFSDTTHNGVYIGTDGIALGRGRFKVSNSGELEAWSGWFTGNVIAGQILSSYDYPDSSFGYFNGQGLTQGSVYGGTSGQIADYTVTGGYGGNLDYNTVEYSNTAYTSTLDQVGVNASNIETLSSRVATISAGYFNSISTSSILFGDYYFYVSNGYVRASLA